MSRIKKNSKKKRSAKPVVNPILVGAINLFHAQALRWIVLGFVLIGASTSSAADDKAVAPWMLKENPEIYPLKKVKAGQVAHGISVFASRKGPEGFKAEILGVVEKFFGSAGDLIIARLYDGPVDKTGVVAGMSGSPVFMDNKLVGAVGYRFGAFTEDAIAGITPFEQMLETFDKTDARLFQGTTQSETAWGKAAPLASPIIFSGLVPEVKNAFAEKLASRGYGELIPALSAGAGTLASVNNVSSFFPGGPIATTLVDGDMKMAGIGTVTWVHGDKFLAFGHPFMGLGETNIPVSYARIVTTVASDAGSWKLGRPVKPAGTLTHDRIFAIGGQTGLKPQTVPLAVTLQGIGFGLSGKKQTFKYDIANHPTDVPLFAAIVSANTMESRNIKANGGTLRVTGALKLSNGRTVAINETVVRHRTSLAMPAAFSVLQQMQDILNIELAEVSLAGVALRMHHSVDLSIEELVGLRWNGAIHAGDRIKVWIQTKPFQKEMQEEVIEVKIPKGLPQGDYLLEVLDHFSYGYLAREEGWLRKVDNFDEFLRQQERLPSADEMTLVLISRHEGGLKIFDENIQPMPDRLKRLLGKGAGSMGVRSRGHAVELGRFKRSGYIMGSIRSDIKVQRPRKK